MALENDSPEILIEPYKGFNCPPPKSGGAYGFET